jgi:hypothetical protein
MSAVTLDAIVNAVVTARPDASPAEQGEVVAEIIRAIDSADNTPAAPAKPVERVADPAAGSGSATMALNWNGKPMKADAGTATPGQVRWHIEHGLKAGSARKLSMVEASNRRARIEGRIAA